MLFEKFVEQHRVHRVVAHGIDLTVIVAHYQLGTHFSYFFSDQAKLCRTLLVVFVVKGHWLQSEQSFAALVHRFDFRFKPARGSGRLGAEPAIAVDVDRLDRSALADVIDASDKGSGVSNGCADADLACFAR